jgi:hypothetical protein
MTDMAIIGRAGVGIAIMIVLDIVAGFSAAVSRGEVDSQKLREGLMHKLALVLGYALAIALEYENAVLHLGIDVPLVSGVAAYIALMEACSVYENVRLINPEFEFTNFDNLFKKVKGDKDE